MSNSDNSNDKDYKDMRGYIAVNDKKTKDSQPSWKGKITIEGKTYYLSLWDKNDTIKNVSVMSQEEMDKVMERYKTNSDNISSNKSNKKEKSFNHYNDATVDTNKIEREQTAHHNKENNNSDNNNNEDDEDPFGDLFDTLPG